MIKAASLQLHGRHVVKRKSSCLPVDDHGLNQWAGLVIGNK